MARQRSPVYSTRKGLSRMKIASPRLDTAHLAPNDSALFRCQTALELKDTGNYRGAEGAMRPLWKGPGERPDTTGLYPPVAAEVLLCAGILTCWIGGTETRRKTEQTANNLHSQSIPFFVSLVLVHMRVAAPRHRAFCYFFGDA